MEGDLLARALSLLPLTILLVLVFVMLVLVIGRLQRVRHDLETRLQKLEDERIRRIEQDIEQLKKAVAPNGQPRIG
jgi:hypothetical protein